MHRPSFAPLPRPATRIDGWIGLAAAGLAAACAAGVAAGALWAGARPVADDAFTEVTVGLGAVRVRSSWMQGAPAARGPSDPLDLAVPWRDLAPAADGADLPARLPAVLVTIHPADGSMAPAERPKHLYARFLSAAATPEDGGLIRRRFRPGTPFEGEDLVLSAPDGRAFAARCLDASSEVATACVAEMRLGALDVQARFAPALLPRWEALTARLNGLVARSGG